MTKLVLEVNVDGTNDPTTVALALLEDLVKDLKQAVPKGRTFSEVVEKVGFGMGAIPLCTNRSLSSADAPDETGTIISAAWLLEGDIADGRNYSTKGGTIRRRLSTVEIDGETGSIKRTPL